MKIQLRYLPLLLLVAVFGFTAYGQEGLMKRGNKKFEQYEYVDAQEVYLRVAESGYASADLYSRLADAYYYNADYDNASQWYEQLIGQYAEEATAAQYFRYAQSLRSTGDYTQSKAMLAQYTALISEDGRASLYNNADTIATFKEGYRVGIYDVSRAGMNVGKYSDFSPSFYEEGLMFASTRDTGGYTNRVHKWNNQPFLDLYVSTDAGVEKLSGEVNTAYHESSAQVSPDGQWLYFTRNNYTNKMYGTDAKRINRLKLYRSPLLSDGSWGAGEELPFNGSAYSTSHPSLSQDGRVLYFASDMPGSKGESDIWEVAIDESGGFSTPTNVARINTPGRETFPYVSDSGMLYFATDGRPGLGGLDVFVYDTEGGGVYNLGAPVNSTKDDFSFIINENDNTGYFASNRGNDPLDDDIYSFNRSLCMASLKVLVVDAQTQEPLTAAQVSIRDADNTTVSEGGVTAPAGSYSYAEPNCDAAYFVRASQEGYTTAEELVGIPADAEEVTVTLALNKSGFELKPDVDLAKELDLNPIYFDFDKSNIRPDAAIELAKVIEVMKQYPELKIDVRSHTDSRGNDNYNMALSERRNTSTINYIVEEGGIARERLSGQGYGESRLVNECDNGSDCSEAAHQLNRRSEFIVKE